MMQSVKERQVLISPLGASKGLLFTALNLVKPFLAIVLTSIDFCASAAEILERTEQTERKIITMQDVFTGFAETDRLVSEVRAICQPSDSVIINLTGGTTAMQWVMQAVYEALKAENFNVKRVAFIDRRDSLDQRKNPFVVGELFEIDK